MHKVTDTTWNIDAVTLDSAREQMILQYAPLVKYVIGRLAIGTPNIMDFDDVLSAGTIGLIQAVDRYDPDTGVKFETYAISRVRGAIIDSLRAVDHLPRSARQKAREVAKTKEELAATLGRLPGESEVAAHIGTTVERLREMILNASWSTISLDGLLESQTYGESIVAELPDAEAHEEVTSGVEREELVLVLSRVVQDLPQRERLVISLYYQNEMTMKEISKTLGISESRVCQIHARALSRLRMALDPGFLAA